MKSRTRSLAGSLWSLTLACFAMLTVSAAQAQLVTVTPIGTANWKPVDFHLFSARFEADFSRNQAVLQSLLPPPYHQYDPSIGIIPGDPHGPPYDSELAAGVAASGYVDKNVYQPEEMAAPNGVLLAFMVVPDPGTQGSSPDFASGPIIPNSQFPFNMTVDWLLNGVSAFGSVTVQTPPPLTEFAPPFNVDGHSHIPFFSSANSEPLSPVGQWTYTVQLTDQLGNGYFISAPFTVVPEPGPVAFLMVCGMFGSILVVARRRSPKPQPDFSAQRRNEMKTPFTGARAILSILLLAVFLGSTARTLAQGNPNPGVAPINSRPYGLSYAEWGDIWWQWALSQPVSISPLFDTTGENAATGQPYKQVFFLAGVYVNSGQAERTITIPSGTALFFPFLNVEWDNIGVEPPMTVEQLYARVTETIAAVTELHVTLDGKAFTNLSSYRATSPAPFTYVLPATDNAAQFFGYDASGPIYPTVSDGFWLMLRPLPVGKHTLNFGGTFGAPINFTLDITYHITVTPHKP